VVLITDVFIFSRTKIKTAAQIYALGGKCAIASMKSYLRAVFRIPMCRAPEALGGSPFPLNASTL